MNALHPCPVCTSPAHERTRLDLLDATCIACGWHYTTRTKRQRLTDELLLGEALIRELLSEAERVQESGDGSVDQRDAGGVGPVPLDAILADVDTLFVAQRELLMARFPRLRGVL